MSDRPSPSNGKRHSSWGTLEACPLCGRCLCFGCHPRGPCLDERESQAALHAPCGHEADRRPSAAA